MQRRTFLKAGLLGGLALAAGGAAYRHFRPATPQRFALDQPGRTMLAALIPAITGLQPAPPALAAGIERVAGAIAALPLSMQKEISDLFGLLTMAPTRRLLAGVPAWPEASPAQVAAFLQNWRTHRTEMLQTAYHGLHDLVLGGWYADPSSWVGSGYHGPMKELSA
ncbi:hypothetical protein GTP41_08135 [Pseudoduganella sp. DS3]|uniref:Twin-arginine translocation pathway signal protein n=1 Tax=Pseudoduganella guangdongensis TaxID=2692179 RepID=A0A6N9HF59_9BURK|nr:hypothetical protein [Pseudoduganella guangdongensis]MYN02070.1 hypothetical protein [Pseudoduganella guangdongensis]